MAADDELVAPPAELLHESAEELYEHAPAGYLSSLPNGAVVKVNQTLLSMTGYERDELVGRKRLHDLLAPGARIYYETHYAPLLALQGSVREIAVELVCADGTRLPTLLNSTLVADEDGLPRVIRTTVFDASDRRRYERELLRARTDAEARARAALALAHVTEGVVLVGLDGRIEATNAAASTILGLPDDAVGRPLLDAVPEWEQLAGRIPVGGRERRTPPVTLPLARGGREQWLAVAAVDSGEGIVHTIRDVTAEHALEQLRSDLVAIVSHELRTPLTGVYGAATTLLARYADLSEAQHRQLLELIVDQTDRLARILDDVLLTSRLDSDDLTVAIDAFAADQALEQLKADVASTSERGRLVLETTPELRARGDADTTRQVLASLVDNALKYSAGPVHVRVARHHASVRFTVADEGPGIPEGERERVFEKFYRLDPAQQRGVGGTGLGLYIAKELVARMHGRIGLLPAERGTTVFVDLPAG